MIFLLLLEPNGLDLDATFGCGQCFRWQRQPDGSWEGVVAGRAVRAAILPGEGGGRLCLEGLAGPDPALEPDFWAGYFALDLDYPALLERMRAAHRGLAGCIGCAPGIRVLRQPFFETLVTFLISQNNNIPRIRGIVDRLCRTLGQPLDGAGRLYAFPTPERLAALEEADLAFLRAGWRAGYILDAARRAAAGQLDEEALRALPLADARARLMEVRPGPVGRLPGGRLDAPGRPRPLHRAGQRPRCLPQPQDRGLRRHRAAVHLCMGPRIRPARAAGSRGQKRPAAQDFDKKGREKPPPRLILPAVSVILRKAGPPPAAAGGAERLLHTSQPMWR